MKKYIIGIFLCCASGLLYSQEYTKGALLYKNQFSKPIDVQDWMMEGNGKIEFTDGVMHMYSPQEASHHVFWCPKDFPGNFIAEWDAQNYETDAGLSIIFFCAKGLNGKDIFDTSLPKRTTGVFTDYTKGAMNCYHISYYANAKDDLHRETANLRKNKGFHLVLSGEKGIPVESLASHHLKLIKCDGNIQMFVDDRKIIDWTDNGVTYGKILEGGKIGFRQMQWTHFSYKNFKVWECKNNLNTH